MTGKNIYSYTLQPVTYDVSEAEQRQAQLLIWRSTNKISKKIWIILAVITLLSLIGIVFIQNYSTIIFWVALAGVVIFLLARIYGLEWYVKRKMNEFPVEETRGIRLGVQPHGISMLQNMGAQQGSGVVSWKDIYEWYEAPDFILVNFKVKGQQGAYILPQRLDGKNFPFKTLRNHLNESVGPAKKL